jgi:hypothetical protein
MSHKHEYEYAGKVFVNGAWRNLYVCACGARMES